MLLLYGLIAGGGAAAVGAVLVTGLGVSMNSFDGNLITIVVTVALAPFSALMVAFSYISLKREKEGVDVRMLAEAFS